MSGMEERECGIASEALTGVGDGEAGAAAGDRSAAATAAATSSRMRARTDASDIGDGPAVSGTDPEGGGVESLSVIRTEGEKGEIKERYVAAVARL